MIWTLFKKECRMLWKSLIFWLYILAVALFFFSQMGTITFEPKPQPEQEGSYGMKLSDKPEDQIPVSYTHLDVYKRQGGNLSDPACGSTL